MVDDFIIRNKEIPQPPKPEPKVEKEEQIGTFSGHSVKEVSESSELPSPPPIPKELSNLNRSVMTPPNREAPVIQGATKAQLATSHVLVPVIKELASHRKDNHNFFLAKTDIIRQQHLLLKVMNKLEDLADCYKQSDQSKSASIESSVEDRETVTEPTEEEAILLDVESLLAKQLPNLVERVRSRLSQNLNQEILPKVETPPERKPILIIRVKQMQEDIKVAKLEVDRAAALAKSRAIEDLPAIEAEIDRLKSEINASSDANKPSLNQQLRRLEIAKQQIEDPKNRFAMVRNPEIEQANIEKILLFEQILNFIEPKVQSRQDLFTKPSSTKGTSDDQTKLPKEKITPHAHEGKDIPATQKVDTPKGQVPPPFVGPLPLRKDGKESVKEPIKYAEKTPQKTLTPESKGVQYSTTSTPSSKESKVRQELTPQASRILYQKQDIPTFKETNKDVHPKVSTSAPTPVGTTRQSTPIRDQGTSSKLNSLNDNINTLNDQIRDKEEKIAQLKAKSERTQTDQQPVDISSKTLEIPLQTLVLEHDTLVNHRQNLENERDSLLMETPEFSEERLEEGVKEHPKEKAETPLMHKKFAPDASQKGVEQLQKQSAEQKFAETATQQTMFKFATPETAKPVTAPQTPPGETPRMPGPVSETSGEGGGGGQQQPGGGNQGKREGEGQEKQPKEENP